MRRCASTPAYGIVSLCLRPSARPGNLPAEPPALTTGTQTTLPLLCAPGSVPGDPYQQESAQDGPEEAARPPAGPGGVQPRACFACVCWSATHRAGHVHGIPYSPPGSPGPGGSQPSASRAQKAREDRLRVHPPQYHKGQDMHGAHTLHSVSCPAFPPNALWPSLPVTGSPLESMKSPTGKSRRKNTRADQRALG